MAGVKMQRGDISRDGEILKWSRVRPGGLLIIASESGSRVRQAGDGSPLSRHQDPAQGYTIPTNQTKVEFLPN